MKLVQTGSASESASNVPTLCVVDGRLLIFSMARALQCVVSVFIGLCALGVLLQQEVISPG